MHLDELDQAWRGTRRASSRWPRPGRRTGRTRGTPARSRVHGLPTERSLGYDRSMSSRRAELTRAGGPALRREGLPRHVDRRPRRGDGRPEGLALRPHRLEGRTCSGDDARGRRGLPRRRSTPSRTTLPATEKIRLALRAHLRVVAEQLDVATVFVREWRYLEGERRVRRRAAALRGALPRALPRGRELGELRTDLDDATAALLALSAANWAYTWLARRARHATSSPTASTRCSSTACAATRRLARAAPQRRACRLIVNPFAQPVATRVATRAARRGRDAAHRAAGPRDRARPRGAGRDAIFVFGGDGVVNEVLNGLSTGDGRSGSSPGGHTNVLARALGVPRIRSRRGAVATRSSGRARRISLGRVNGRRFAFARRDRGRLRDRARSSNDRSAPRTGRRAATSPSRRVVARALLGGVRPLRRLEVEGLGRAGVRARLERRASTPTPGRIPLRVSPDGALRARPRRLAPRAGPGAPLAPLAPTCCAAAAGAAAGHALRGTTSTGSWCRCDEPLPLQADGEDLGDVTEAVFEAERGRGLGPRGLR